MGKSEIASFGAAELPNLRGRPKQGQSRVTVQDVAGLWVEKSRASVRAEKQLLPGWCRPLRTTLMREGTRSPEPCMALGIRLRKWDFTGPGVPGADRGGHQQTRIASVSVVPYVEHRGLLWATTTDDLVQKASQPSLLASSRLSRGQCARRRGSARRQVQSPIDSKLAASRRSSGYWPIAQHESSEREVCRLSLT